ncbi:hypothetical protein [Pectinatus haikarae]|uniref:Phage protein n=1 Tax=Pectinatus haikarae TaxID=349096 RepID=A0ABT9Y3U4_9FIRM|nr:hypothetical protein [Pectinatus haikarae]MDQ0202493.1 hypothetical protein [Pectinatus haikarae]
MANIYFAKVNINSDVYEIYKNKEKADIILKNLFNNIDQDKRIKIDKKTWIKFINIDKDYKNHQFVVGRLVKVFDADIGIYNELEDDVKPLSQKDLAKSVAFYFDLSTELVAFTTAQFLSRAKFIEYFSKLINSYEKDITFEVFLKKNINKLNEEIKQLEKVSEVEIVVIPPNGNDDEFKDLFAQNSEEVMETKATKIKQSYSSSARGEGMNMESKFFQRIILGISKGFGYINVTGKNKEGEKRIITSEEAAPQKEYIPDYQKNSLPAIKEVGRASIVKILINERVTKG